MPQQTAPSKNPLPPRLKGSKLAAPLRLKFVILVALVLAPEVLLLACIPAYLRFVPSPDTLAFLSGAISLGFVRVPNMLLVALACISISLAVGLFAADRFFIAPASRLLRFIGQLREQGFTAVPVLPDLPADEIGEIGRQMAYAALQFGRMREETDQSNEQRSLFLMTAAHQLRTPLSELLWSIDDLRSSRSSPEEKDQLLVSVDGTLRRMRHIIEHLLSGAGVEEGRFGYVFEQIDVVPVIERIVGEFQPLCERRHVSIVFQPVAVMPVYADTQRLSVVLFDLISNAIDYTPAGGNVIVSVAPAGERVQITVADSGIGILDSERPLLFNKFYRSERARHMRPDGSGLGLYLSRAILEKHGSDILIDSQEGKGTKVTFYLHSKRENVSA